MVVRLLALAAPVVGPVQNRDIDVAVLAVRFERMLKPSPKVFTDGYLLEVVWVDAPSIATQVVEDKTVGDFSVYPQVREAVRGNRELPSSSDFESSITTSVPRSSPFPAAIRPDRDPLQKLLDSAGRQHGPAVPSIRVNVVGVDDRGRRGRRLGHLRTVRHIGAASARPNVLDMPKGDSVVDGDLFAWTSVFSNRPHLIIG
jgi:hypothetical protein